MKKIYFLCLLLCINITARAQTTVTIWAGGGTTPSYLGSYLTGSSIQTIPPSTYARFDNTIAITNSGSSRQAGYAVFDLSSIPAGATISSVTLGLDVFGATLNIYEPCVTYGHLMDLSTVTTASTLYTDCTTAFGPPGSILIANAGTATAAGSYLVPGGLGVGELDMTSAAIPALATFVTTAANSLSIPKKVSISFSANPITLGGGSPNVYNFTGENGSQAVLGPHAPFLTISYCIKPSNVSAIAMPAQVCAGATLSLTAVATGASTYQWFGPGGFSTPVSASPTATLTATGSSAGSYTVVAHSSCDSTKAATGIVTVKMSPAAIITTTTTVCSGIVITVSDITPGGIWSSSNTASATVDGIGNVSAVSYGKPVISYSLNGCPATVVINVNDPPGIISGPTDVCVNQGNITLSNAALGGTWSSGNTVLATIDSFTGVVTGTSIGLVDITYTTGACPFVSESISVDPLPTGIIGGTTVCELGPLALSDATPGGTWSVDSVSLATVDPVTGVVTGVRAAPVVNVTYTLPTGCYATTPLLVNPAPAAITGRTDVCVGLTISLTDATPGGTWSTGDPAIATAGSLTGVVTGVSAAVVDISYTLITTGCSVVYPVVVDPLPDPIAGLNTVCVKSVITLSDDIPGGTWSSQLTAVATVDPVTGDVTGVAAGGSFITYTLSGTGCYITDSVIVNPQPPAIITPSGPTTFCAGGSVTLNASPGAGYGYQWYSNGAVTGLTTSSYLSTTTEMILVVVTDANGCSDTSATTQVTLIPSVTIVAGGPTVFCQTGNVVLTVPLSPGINYQWRLNGTNISGATAHTYAATANGIYICDLVVPGGCFSSTPPFTVVVHPLPLPVVSYSGTALSTSISFITYQWYLNSVAIPGATTNTVVPTVNGSYRIRVTDGNGCTNYSAGFAINRLAVASINTTDIKIYPNPVNTVVHIESAVSVHAVITGMEGKTLIEENGARDLDITKLPDGLYMIILYNKNGDRLMVQKLIKE